MKGEWNKPFKIMEHKVPYSYKPDYKKLKEIKDAR